MTDEQDRIIPRDYVVESIKAELEGASSSRRQRIFEAIALAALGSIPWVGGVISAASSYKAGESDAQRDTFFGNGSRSITRNFKISVKPLGRWLAGLRGSDKRSKR